MSPLSFNFYAQARERGGVLPVLRDAGDAPPERLLQAVWLHQRLQRDQLRTLDGQPVRVLHPGFPSVEGGPDFRDALLRIGDAPPRRGDVEVDLRTSGWRAHGHDRNPHFNHVILHVVWEAERAANAALPVLPLRGMLDAPPGELARWLGGEAAGTFPEEWRGRCAAPLRGLTPASLTNRLHEAAAVRLHSKAAQFEARARVVGWEQALWEGLFRALGYKHNAWPMQWLAERRPRWGVKHNLSKTDGICLILPDGRDMLYETDGICLTKRTRYGLQTDAICFTNGRDMLYKDGCSENERLGDRRTHLTKNGLE